MYLRVKLPTPERKGYTFEGWYTSTSGGDRVTESSVCKDEKDATLYARWANQQFNVYFNSNGGSCSTNNKTVTYNNSYGDLPSATRTGYTFAGYLFLYFQLLIVYYVLNLHLLSWMQFLLIIM